MHKNLRVVAVAISAGLAGLSVAAGSSSPASAHPQLPAKTHLYGWHKLSTANVGDLASIGLTRTGSDVDAVWRQNDGDRATLQTAIVSSSGKPTGATVEALAPWDDINSYPAILPHDGGLLIAFSGIRETTDPSDPYAQGYEYVVASSNGKTWAPTTVPDVSLTNSATAYGSYGTDVVDAGGQPVIGYTSSSSEYISYHEGIITPIPADPSPDLKTANTGTFAQDTGLGYDATTKQTWAVWWSNSSGKTKQGIQAQPIEPTLGTLSQGPDSVTRFPPDYASTNPDQRLEVASRSDGGEYVAYPVGFPDATKVALWRLGSHHVLTIKTGGDVALTGTAPGPGGRLWIYWQNSGATTVEAARTNPTQTKVGCAQAITTPGKAEAYDIEGNGSQGPLELFINAGTNTQAIYSTAVKACLTVNVSPHTISSKHGGRVTVTVTDAGHPVSGSKVSLLGARKTTNSHGKASFHVAKHTGKGKHTITVSGGGYKTVTSSFRVH